MFPVEFLCPAQSLYPPRQLALQFKGKEAARRCLSSPIRKACGRFMTNPGISTLRWICRSGDMARIPIGSIARSWLPAD